MAESSPGKKFIKGYIYAVLLGFFGLAGVTWYFYEKADDSVKALQGSQRKIINQALDLKDYHAPSLNKYYEMVQSGQLQRVDPEKVSKTSEALYGVLKGKNGIEPDRKSELPKNEEGYTRHGISVKFSGVTRIQYEKVLRDVRAEFDTYATIESLRISVDKHKDLPLGTRVSEAQVLHSVEFTLVWYTAIEKPPASATGTGRT